MKIFINTILLISFTAFITGCTSSVLKAPCDNQGNYCGKKVKINHW